MRLGEGVRDENEHEQKITRIYDSAAETLRTTIEHHRERASELRREAHEAESLACFIEEAVQAGHWWKLGCVLDDHEIETLCKEEPYPPVSLLSDYGWENYRDTDYDD